MGYFDQVYTNRLNRYGNDYQSRVQGQRAKVFQQYLLKSVYRVDFEEGGEQYTGTLEPYKQDETQTLQYLLLPMTVEFAPGTILNIPDKFGLNKYWMIYWLEEDNCSRGYNRYVVLKMSHIITWTDRNGDTQTTRAYFFGPETKMKDTIKMTLYWENHKDYSFITSLNENIHKGDYFEISISDGSNTVTDAYVVNGYDIQSTLGVEYVTVDPFYIRDHSEDTTSDNDEYYWLGGN